MPNIWQSASFFSVKILARPLSIAPRRLARRKLSLTRSIMNESECPACYRAPPGDGAVHPTQFVEMYDALNRLLTAVTADNPNIPQWGQQFGYDGFGNLLTETVTKGSAPYLNQTVDTATNRVDGQTYDANGNPTSDWVSHWGMCYSDGQNEYCSPPYSPYNVENRRTLVFGNGSSTPPAWSDGFGPDGRRMWKGTYTWATQTYEGFSVYYLKLSSDEVHFRGIDGVELGTYTIHGSGSLTARASEVDLYFGQRRMETSTAPSTWTWVTLDRLGSAEKYYPYGEARGTPSGTPQFATYRTDPNTGIRSGDWREYPGQGRFATPDPVVGEHLVHQPDKLERVSVCERRSGEFQRPEWAWAFLVVR